jgi:hypothetical protein
MKFRHNFPADGEYRFTILDLDVGLYTRTLETRHTLVMLSGWPRSVFARRWRI